MNNITNAINTASARVRVRGATVKWFDLAAAEWRTVRMTNPDAARAWAWGARVAIALTNLGWSALDAARAINQLSDAERGSRWTNAARRIAKRGA